MKNTKKLESLKSETFTVMPVLGTILGGGNTPAACYYNTQAPGDLPGWIQHDTMNDNGCGVKRTYVSCGHQKN